MRVLAVLLILIVQRTNSSILPVVSFSELEKLNSLISEGYNAYEAGYPDSAHKIFEEAIQIDTSFADGYYHNGCIYAKEGKDSLAIEYLVRAIGKKFVFLTYSWFLYEDTDWNKVRKIALWQQVYDALRRKIEKLQQVTGPEKKYAYFEIARINAAIGDTDSVFKYTELAIDNGFSQLDMFERNKDFTQFQCDSFKKFVREKIEQKYKWTGSIEQKIWGLMLVYSEIKYNCANLNLGDFNDWDEEVKKYIPLVINARTKLEYYRILARLVSSINDNHTRILGPRDIVQNYTIPPLLLIGIKGRVFVEKVLSQELLEKGIKPGMEIIEVNNIAVQKYLADSIYPYLPHKPKQYAEWRGAKVLLIGPKGTEVKLKLKDLQGNILTVNIKREGFKLEQKPLVELKELEDGIVYINIRTFAKKEVLDEFYECFNKLDLEKVKGMIIDVRENHGGNSGYGDEIISHLIQRPIKNYVNCYSPLHVPSPLFVSSLFKYHHLINKANLLKLSSDMREKLISPAKDKVYTGPLVILTSPATCSAAEDFVYPLKESGRAIIVGMPTGGGTGNPLYVNLPGGGKLRICIDTAPFVGKGIMPDIEVYPTQKDLAEGRDPILEKAISVLNKSVKSTH